jgi:hypothetical protein
MEKLEMYAELFDINKMEKRTWISPDGKFIDFLESSMFICKDPRYDDGLYGHYEIQVTRWAKNTKVALVHILFDPGLMGDDDKPDLDETFIQVRKAPNDDMETLCKFVDELIELANKKTSFI